MTDPRPDSANPRTLLPDARRTPRFAGVSTFCRFPRLEDVPAAGRPVDWVVYGVPFDGGVTYRPGARFGPRAIRDASQYMKPYLPEQDVHLAISLSLADGGDAPVRPFSCEDNLNHVHEFAVALGDAKHARLFAVGGDHSIALANIRATWERRGQPKGGLALIHFDAHLDTVDQVWDERYSHASPFLRAIEQGWIDPARSISIGIRGGLNSPADLVFARERGITILGPEAMRCEAGREAVRAFSATLGRAETYLSFDIDCVDPAFAPGTGTPVCGGFSSSEALSILRSFRGANVAGADIVEVLPDRDVAGITALLASHVIMEVLALGVPVGGGASPR